MTDWQSRYQAQDTPWDKGTAAPPLVDWLREKSMPGAVLAPGCGFGHDVRAIAAKGNTVVGLDLAAAAVEGANQFPKMGNESYLAGDFFQLPTDMQGKFGTVFEHTCFCAIDPADRPRYVKSVVAALQPGGQLIGIFFINPDHDAGPPFRTNAAELAELFENDFVLLEAKIPECSYPGREGREEWRIYQLKESV